MASTTTYYLGATRSKSTPPDFCYLPQFLLSPAVSSSRTAIGLTHPAETLSQLAAPSEPEGSVTEGPTGGPAAEGPIEDPTDGFVGSLAQLVAQSEPDGPAGFRSESKRWRVLPFLELRKCCFEGYCARPFDHSWEEMEGVVGYAWNSREGESNATKGKEREGKGCGGVGAADSSVDAIGWEAYLRREREAQGQAEGDEGLSQEVDRLQGSFAEILRIQQEMIWELERMIAVATEMEETYSHWIWLYQWRRRREERRKVYCRK
ncbi:MAG: hypothetical protein Q9159_001513 [Coniocarpon cinnabarinum]